MSRNPLFPAKPARITLDTLPDLFAHHRARFGGWSMTQTPPEPNPPGSPPTDPPTPPERPDDIPEDTWNSLGDPGKQAIVRERDRANAAERALAAARAKPAPPKKTTEPPKPAEPPAPKDGDQPDFAAIIKQAVSEAVKPFAEAEERRQTETAAEKIRTAVVDAATPLLHDATDALANIDLTTVVTDQGTADAEKLKTALDDLVKRKPHLAKAGQQRLAPPGIGGGAPAGTTEGEKVKAALEEMQRATGVRPAAVATPSN